LLLQNLELTFQKKDDNYFMCCPIHEASDNPHGLSISKSKMSWRCWTRGCHEQYNTDILGFINGVLSKENEASFSDVLRFVCKIYNISHQEFSDESEEKVESEFSTMVKIFNNKEQETYTNLSFPSIKTSNGSEYFEQRGFSSSTLKHFNITDCLDKKSHMYGRSIIPAHNQYGKQIGFIARSNKDYVRPKYLYSDGFKKSQHLYNQHRATSTAIETSCLFLTEGQGDVWKMYEAGVENCVGLFGKDISHYQKDKLLKSGVTILIILTDNDQAGREAKIKIKRELSRLFTLKFPKMSRKDIGDMSIESIRAEITSNLKGLY
jgi:DNA primase